MVLRVSGYSWEPVPLSALKMSSISLNTIWSLPSCHCTVVFLSTGVKWSDLGVFESSCATDCSNSSWDVIVIWVFCLLSLLSIEKKMFLRLNQQLTLIKI